MEKMGLQDYAGIIGLGEACRYLKKLGQSNIMKHEIKLNSMITESLLDNKKLSVIGPADAEKRSGIFSFNIEGMNPHDVARMLDSSKGIMIRSGMHCCHSWFNARGMRGSARASLYLYNTEKEADVFISEVKKIRMLAK